MFLHTCTVVSGGESEGEEGDGEGGDRAEVTLKMKQALLEEEKQALMQNKELLDEVGNDSTLNWQSLSLSLSLST